MKKSFIKFIIPTIIILMSFVGCIPTANGPADEWTDVVEADMPDLVGKWISDVTTSSDTKMPNHEGMMYKTEYPSITINFYNYKEDKKVITKFQPEYDYTVVYYKENGAALNTTEKNFLESSFKGGAYNDEETIYKYKKNVQKVELTGAKMIYLKKGTTSFKIDKSRTKIQIDGIVYTKSGEADKAPVVPGEESNDNDEDLSNIQWPVRYEIDLKMTGKTTLVFNQDQSVTVELYDVSDFGEKSIIIEAIVMEGTYEGNPDSAKNHTVDLDILRVTDQKKINEYWLEQYYKEKPVALTFEASRKFLHDVTDEEKANLPYQVIIKNGVIDSYN